MHEMVQKLANFRNNLQENIELKSWWQLKWSLNLWPQISVGWTR